MPENDRHVPPFIEEFAAPARQPIESQPLGSIALDGRNSLERHEHPAEAVAEPLPMLKQLKNRLVGVWARTTERFARKGQSPDTVEIGNETETLEQVHDMRPFYAEQIKAWKEAPYGAEELTKYFTPDHLSSLTVDEYGLLMSRFPGEMVTHVTRQGIRDHSSMIYHTAGLGEYASGFADMLKTRHLRSPLGVYMFESEKETAMQEALHLDRYPDKDAALDSVKKITHPDQGEKGSYVDKTAVHFAAEEVGDAYYGSETGNEIFIAYPTAMIASQYHFSGDVLNPKIGDQWNDVWVWTQEEKGMSLDAGLVFIPKDTPVDKNNGSRYQLDENNMPLPNRPALEAVDKLLDNKNFGTFMQDFDMAWRNTAIEDPVATEAVRIEYVDRLAKEYGISEPKLVETLLDYDNRHDWQQLWGDVQKGSSDKEYYDTVVGGLLSTVNLEYLPASDTISSQEYWEKQFAANGWHPSKVVYYEGENPTRALNEWRSKYGIRRQATKDDLGLGRYIQRNHEAATKGLDRFRDLAFKVVEDYFTHKSR